LRVKTSPFDFPVIGYLVECLDSKARAEWIVNLDVRIRAIERSWHSDMSSVVTERFKIISTYQLLAHSEAVAAGKTEWLSNNTLYQPPWEDGSRYRSLKYDAAIGGGATFSNCCEV
jgi:hypothetical protein